MTVSPGYPTTVREGADLGAGVITIEKHEIGTCSIIGASAVVVRDIPSDVTTVSALVRFKET